MTEPERFLVEITCDRHGARPRVIDSFVYAEHNETGQWQWFWQSSRKTGGGKLDHVTGIREWYQPGPSHRTVREDFPDGVHRVFIRCPNAGHPNVGMTWSEFVARYLEPCRANGVHEVPVREIVSSRTAPTHRR